MIDLDEAHGKVLTHEQSAKSDGVCLTTVTNTVKKYFDDGIEAVVDFKRNINSDNARRVLDGRAEARIIELACGPVPEGHSRWTIRLLEKESRIILETPVGREDVPDVYELPYDAKCSVVCMDEKPYQLLGGSPRPHVGNSR